MIQATDISQAEHYLWGEVCDGWRLLNLPDLSVIQERVPPGAGEMKHVHARARQFFYVLSGYASLELEAETVALSPGQGLHVPPGVAHRFVNKGDEAVVFLVISAPTTLGDRTNLE